MTERIDMETRYARAFAAAYISVHQGITIGYALKHYIDPLPDEKIGEFWRHMAREAVKQEAKGWLGN